MEDAKAHLVVDHNDDDLLILSQIKAASKWVEHRTGRFYTPTNVVLSVNGFSDTIYLPHRPVQEIVSVVYDDVDTTDQTLSTSLYELDKGRNCMVRAYGQVYPSVRHHWNSVRITYRVGHYTAGSPEVVAVPNDVQAACLIVLGDLYANRERQQDMALYENRTADMLLQPYRVWE